MPDYTVIRSGRKTVAITIASDGKVIVRAPYLVSDKKIKDFVESKAEWIAEKSELAKKKHEKTAELTPEDERKYINMASDILPDKVKHYADIMGLYPDGVRITSARKRLGSCSGKNSICFSWRLMLYDDDVIDYVVVHELAHIKHKNHGRDFYAFIERYLPDYRSAVKKIKEN